MVQGFTSLDREMGWAEDRNSWSNLADIAFGDRANGGLAAKYESSEGVVWFAHDDPVSFRVHDERELHTYWLQRTKEAAPIATVYEIQSSAYLEEMKASISGFGDQPLRHFLIATDWTCLEIIATRPPTLHFSPPPGSEALST